VGKDQSLNEERGEAYLRRRSFSVTLWVFASTRILSVVAAALLPRHSIAAEPASTNLLSLQSVLSEVFSNNPSLKAARANWEAMRERVPQARAWEDARAGFDATLDRFVSVPPNSFMDYKWMAEQTIPLSGKNRLRGQAASAEAVAAFEEFRRRKLDLVARARTAYFRLANAYTQLEINQKNTELLRQFRDVSRAKYEAGSQSQADVLSAETELARLGEAAVDFQRQVSEGQTQLNVLMNRSAGSPLGHPEAVAHQIVNLLLENVEKLALAHRPELLVAEEKIKAAEARLKVARREWIPEPSFRLEASRYNEASQAISEVDAGFSINLPWFNRAKYSAGIRESQKMLETAQHQLAALRAETLGLIRDQLTKVETFHHHFQLFQNTLVPLARQTADSKRRSYETDKASFLDLLTAQRTLQELEAMSASHHAEYQIALAELEALLGAGLIALPPENQPNRK